MDLPAPKNPRAGIQSETPVQGSKKPPCRDPKPPCRDPKSPRAAIRTLSVAPVQGSKKDLKMTCFQKSPCRDPPTPVQGSVFKTHNLLSSPVQTRAAREDGYSHTPSGRLGDRLATVAPTETLAHTESRDPCIHPSLQATHTALSRSTPQTCARRR